MSECEVTLMPIDQCAHCKGVSLDDDWSDAIIANRFTARFDSTAACGHFVTVGDAVAFTTDSELLCRGCSR